MNAVPTQFSRAQKQILCLC